MCTCMYGGMNVRTYVRAHACLYVEVVDELEAKKVENCFWTQQMCVCGVCVCVSMRMCVRVYGLVRVRKRKRQRERESVVVCVRVCDSPT